MEDTQIFAKRRRELQELQNQRAARQPRPMDEQPTPEPSSEPETMEKDQPREAYNTKGGEETKMKLIYPIIGIAAIAVAGYYAFMTTTLHAKEVENEARFQCASSSRYQVVKDGTTIWYPAAELYTKCLQEKGVK